MVEWKLKVILVSNITKRSLLYYLHTFLITIVDVMDTPGSFTKKKALAHQSLVLYPTAEQTDMDRPLVLNAGLTQFGFEMQVPSGLPETIECNDIKVHYHVSASMEYYPTNSFLRAARRTQKEYTKQDVRVARLPYENVLLGDSMSDPIDSRNHKSAWMNYHLLIDKKAVPLGSELPITFKFAPTREEVSVDRVNIQLLERRNLYRDVTHTTHSVHYIAPCKDNAVQLPDSALSGDWEGTISYKIPEGKSLVHSTQEYSDFNVSHTLLVTILFSIPGSSRINPTRVQKMVTFQTNIDILNEAVGELDSLKLPTYDSPPPFDNTTYVYGEYDRKFTDPPNYSEIYV